MDILSEPSFFDNEVSNSSVATTSSSVEDATAEGLLTKEMIKEEKKVEEELLKEEAKAALAEELRGNKEECFKKLLELLNLSKAYTKYLVEKMKVQEEERKRREDQLKDKLMQKLGEQKTGSSPTRPKLAAKNNKDSPTPGKRKRSSPKENEDAAGAKKMKVSPTLSQEMEVRLSQPLLLTGGVMRKYQLEGLEWMKLLYENGVNGILADEMGLGKTIQSIALIAHLVYSGVPGPFMIVAPLSTLPNWKLEFNRFAPEIPAEVYHGVPDERREVLRRIFVKGTAQGKAVYPVMLISYNMVIRDARYLRTHLWRYLIIDEGHRIKNFQCRLIRDLKSFRSSNRLLLTGTPLQNNLAELWSLLNFLLPEIFNDLGVFEAWFDVSEMTSKERDKEIIQQEQEKKILSTMHQILAPFLLRRTKADVALALPPKKEIVVYAPLSAEQKKLYKESLDRNISSVAAEKEASIELDEKGRPIRSSALSKKSYTESTEKTPLDATSKDIVDWQATKEGKKVPPKKLRLNHSMSCMLMQLRKVCNHPYLVEQPLSPSGEYIYGSNMVALSGKLSLLDSMLPALKQRGHKVLLFSQMVAMLDILEEYCLCRKYKYGRLDGSMKLPDRQEMIEDFNSNPDTFVFLVSTRAGGLGINLTAADTVIIYDSDWNPQMDLQAQDRCHRLGQTRPVVVYRLVTVNTIDQAIVERAAAKRKLEKMIMKQGRFLGKEEKSCVFTSEELLSILQSKDHEEVHSAEQQYQLTQQQLDMLLDRSNMEEGSAAANNGLFKVISSTHQDIF